MSIDACAAIVERGDPARFLAAMASPPRARRILFPLYAFNVQVARAPWVTAEPMIAEMRLQWWRDALEEIAGGGHVRRHEVTDALAEVLDPDGARALDSLVAARRWDVYKDAFEDAAHFADYIEATAGTLMWEAARAMGADAARAADVMQFGAATGTARFLSAVPALEAAGRIPLVDGTRAGIAALASDALAQASRPRLPNSAAPATVEGWETSPLLRQIAKDPGRVEDGRVGMAPFASKLRLLLWS